MPEIIQEARWETGVELRRVFERRSDPSSGYSFPCDEQGEPLPGEMQAAGWRSYFYVLDHPEQYADRGVVKRRWACRHPAIIRCPCGKAVSLDDAWLNICSCGRDFDGAGNVLAPRSQWGEETGESLAEMMAWDE